MQKQVSVKVPKSLKEKMEKHQEVNWSEVIRKALREYLSKLELADKIASKSKLTEKEAEELSKQVKQSIARRHEEKNESRSGH